VNELHTPTLVKLRRTPQKPVGGYLAPAELPYFQTLLNRLGLAGGSAEALQTIGFTACARRAGVSTLAIGLAELVARSGQQVLLVDACYHSTGLAHRLGVSPTPGLWDLLAGETSFDLAITPTDADNLTLLPGGSKPGDGLLLAARAELAQRIGQWKERFDFVVLDLPPAAPQEPLVVWSGAVDGVVLVIEAEKTDAEEARQVKRTLLDCEARLLGAVLTRQRSYLPRWLCRRV
jgi:Mrp family chromosome partitioning ATPase